MNECRLPIGLYTCSTAGNAIPPAKFLHSSCRRRCNYRAVSRDRCVTAEGRRRTAHLHRSAHGRLLSLSERI